MIIAAIEDNLENPFVTNALLAEKCGLSERQFYRKVEDITGMSPNHLIRTMRIEKAKELLYSGEFRTVKEVALRVGFLKVSYFSQKFKESCGIKPSEILRKN